MADNTPVTNGVGDTYRSKDRAGVKTDIVGLDIGIGTGTEALLSAANPMPVALVSAGVAATSIADGAGGVGAGVAFMATNFVHSNGNSSVVQLAAAATFTGIIETIFNQQAISILVTADQNGTLHIKQYIDAGGTRTIADWTYLVVAGVPYSRSFVGNGNYFNLTYHNDGGSTTTTLNLDTAYGTLPAATNFGNAPVSINEINGVATASKSGALSVKGAAPTGQSLNVTAATPVTGTGLDASEAGNVTFVIKNTVAATAFTGVPVIVFEQSDDNVSWAPLPVAGSTVSASPVIATGAANVEQMFDAALEGVNWVRVRVTTAQAANGMTVVTIMGGMPFSPSVAISGTVTRKIDSGRVTRVFMLDLATAAPVAEAVQSVVQWYGNAAVAATVSPVVVPVGKTLRLTGYKIQYQSIATFGYAVVRIRANIAGLGVLASPLVASFEAGSIAGATTAAVTTTSTQTGAFPEGLELPAGTGLAFSMAGYGPTGVLTLEGVTRFEVHGYEYTT